ncbi:branched-chain amino acid ABC transporter permease [Pseudorhodoferax soli]|nr:branched-chain amino acid ABC transporter permease [Pseudorhodoferax soli]
MPLNAPRSAAPAAARNANVWWLLLLLLALAVPFQSVVYPVFVMKILCYALFACAFNLLLGYAGLLSFGHAAFFGGASYATAYLCTSLGVGPLAGLAAGALVGVLLGTAVGAIAIRRTGIYFAMVTLALAQLIYFLALQAPFTGGEDGIQNIPRGELLGLVDLSNDTAMYYLVLAVFCAGFALVHRVVHSPFGEVLTAIRENEARATSLGYRVNHYKLLAFVLSSGLAGLAGSTKALVFQVATLSDVRWHASGEVVLMALLGGVGTLLGPMVGAGVVVTLQKYLSGAGSWSTVIIGLVFMACVLAFRRGIVGEIQAWLDQRGRR